MTLQRSARLVLRSAVFSNGSCLFSRLIGFSTVVCGRSIATLACGSYKFVRVDFIEGFPSVCRFKEDLAQFLKLEL